MKWNQRTIAVLVLLCVGAVSAAAQSPCSDKILTTSTTASVNFEKPAMKNYDPSRLHPMIFDWTRDYFPLHSNAGSLLNRTTLRSPFFQGDNSNTLHLAAAPDMASDDGWELIRQDFGYVYQPHPDDPLGLKRIDGQGNPDPVGNPYFILYNRYTGVLRIFVAVGQLEQAYNAAQILIYQVGQNQQDLQSSLLYESSSVKPVIALDEFPSAPPRLMAATPFNNEGGLWFYADFPTVYDPCTCLYTSSLQIEVNLISQSAVELVGETEGTLISITNNQGNVNTDNRPTSFGLTDLVNTGKKAAESYKHAQDFSKKLIESINAEKKEEVENKLDIDLGDGPLTDEDWQDLYDSWDPVTRSIYEAAAYEYEEKEKTANTFESFLGSLGFLEQPLKAVPFLAAAVDVVDFFVGGGKKEPAKPQRVEVQPMAIRMTTKLTGTITAEDTYKTITLFTPGAKDNSTRLPESSYPMYNQTLGVFNLLKTPKVKAYYYPETVQVDRLSTDTYLYKSTATRYYQLEEDIAYVVNPAAGFDMDNIEILASLVFEFDYDIAEELRAYDRHILELEAYNRYRTRYVPVGCIRDLFVQFLYRDVYSIISPYNTTIDKPVSRAPRVYLKLMVRLPRADRDENTQGVLFVGAYPVTLNDVPTYTAAEWTTTSDYNTVPNDRVFSNENVAGQFDAWSTITVDAGADVGEYWNGNTGVRRATLTAGERITVKPGGRVHPTGRLQIGVAEVCSRPLPPATPAEVLNFCTSTAYTTPRRFPKEAVIGEPPSEASPTELTGITPNPSSGVVTVHYSVGGTAPVTIEIVNPLGVRIATLVDTAEHATGDHTAVFDGSALPRGVYFCVLRSNGSSAVEKFVLY